VRLSEWALYAQSPSVENGWAFVEEFSSANPHAYSPTFDTTLLALWTEACELFDKIKSKNRASLLPADLYFTFSAGIHSFEFSFEIIDISGRSTPSSLHFHVIRSRQSNRRTEPHPVLVECYLSNVMPEDRAFFATNFQDKKYVFHGSRVEIWL
jgi:hypothetical protein